MEFIAFRFDCWPLALATGDRELDDEIARQTEYNFDHRLEVLNSIFGSAEDVNYTLGDGSQPPFKVVHDLILRTYKRPRTVVDDDNEEAYSKLLVEGNLKKAEGLKNVTEPGDFNKIPKSIYDEHIPARIIYNLGHIFVLRIQKKRPLEGENKDYKTVVYKENYVSSLAILILKKDMQFLLIENTRKTYAPSTVARFFEHTFNRLLMIRYHMMTTVSPIHKLSDFWSQIEDCLNKGHRIKSLRFKFAYPNMPWPDDLLGGRFKRLGRELNAESEIILKGQHGQMLDIKTAEGERDPDINSMARYSCDKGNKIYVELDTKNVMTFGNKQTGSVSAYLPDSIGATQANENPELFPEDLEKKIDEEAKRLKALNE